MPMFSPSLLAEAIITTDIIHNAARKASDVFCSSCGFDVEEFCIDIYYWFDKSTKRKNSLLSYCTFCDQEYRNIIKHVTTRWLSLKCAIERILKQYPSLKSYFLSENERQPRFQRLHDLCADPTTEIFCYFSRMSFLALQMQMNSYKKKNLSFMCCNPSYSTYSRKYWESLWNPQFYQGI